MDNLPQPQPARPGFSIRSLLKSKKVILIFSLIIMILLAIILGGGRRSDLIKNSQTVRTTPEVTLSASLAAFPSPLPTLAPLLPLFTPADELDASTAAQIQQIKATVAGWKLYSDAVLNSSFVYPPDWSVELPHYANPSAKDVWIVTLKDPAIGNVNCKTACPKFSLTFTLRKNLQNQHLSQIIAAETKILQFGRKNPPPIAVTDIINPNGLYFKKVTGASDTLFILYTAHNRNILTVTVNSVIGNSGSSLDTKLAGDRNIAAFVLSSLKFTDVPPETLTPEDLCKNGQYQSVIGCDFTYFGLPADKSHPTDIWDSSGKQLIGCVVGYQPTPEPECLIYRKIYRATDQSNCRKISCSTTPSASTSAEVNQ